MFDIEEQSGVSDQADAIKLAEIEEIMSAASKSYDEDEGRILEKVSLSINKESERK